MQQFTAIGTYTDNSTANITSSVTWSSSASGVATISNVVASQGVATAVATGQSTITATSGSMVGSTTLTASNGDDAYEPNSSKTVVDVRPVGGTNSPNLRVLTATKTIQNLVMNDAADWFKFQTQGVGTTANSLTISFTPASGDLDLYLYLSDGSTLLRSAANDFGVGNVSPETISLAGVPSGTYYAVVVPHTTGGTNPNYTLQITALAPPATTPTSPIATRRPWTFSRLEERTRRTSGC